MKEPTCPQCRTKMEVGHLLDHSHAQLKTVQWVAGAADWTGVQWWPGGKLRKREVYGVVAYRCPDCGQLASFAHTRVSPMA